MTKTTYNYISSIILLISGGLLDSSGSIGLLSLCLVLLSAAFLILSNKEHFN